MTIGARKQSSSALVRGGRIEGEGAFFLINTVYFMASEEPGLERRFGEDYRRYKAAVPRWRPRLTAYEG